MDNLPARDNSPADEIGQARLPLSFGLADAAQFKFGVFRFDDRCDAHFGIQPAQIFHLACRILEGKATPSSLIVAQATADLPTTEDHEPLQLSFRMKLGDSPVPLLLR